MIRWPWGFSAAALTQSCNRHALLLQYPHQSVVPLSWCCKPPASSSKSSQASTAPLFLSHTLPCYFIPTLPVPPLHFSLLAFGSCSSRHVDCTYRPYCCFFELGLHLSFSPWNLPLIKSLPYHTSTRLSLLASAHNSFLDNLHFW